MKDVYELIVDLDTCRVTYHGDRDRLEEIRKTLNNIIDRRIIPEHVDLGTDCIFMIELLNENKEVIAYLISEEKIPKKEVIGTKASITDEVKEWVKTNYNPAACGWTAERSFGNCDDCFYDGQESGISCAAYEIGCILGLDLEEPEEAEEDFDI